MGTARTDRRRFLGGAASAAAIVVVGCDARVGCGSGAASGETEVTPGEDLMQEHGVLERVLLIYEEVAARLEGGRAVDGAPVAAAADIVQRFVEAYHEKLEEDFVFPRLERAHRELDLVGVLRRQHQRGREITAQIASLAGAGRASAELVPLLRGFGRMYRPHAAREDTVLFPAFREVVGGGMYRELGEVFEAQEHARFGAHGFEETVAAVAKLEAGLGIGELAAFTP